MRVKTSELSGAALDWAVAKCEGNHITFSPDGLPSGQWEMYSSNWSVAGPIIEEFGISVSKVKAIKSWHWVAGLSLPSKAPIYGPTPLIAAMRCYVASKLGDEVEIPDALIS